MAGSIDSSEFVIIGRIVKPLGLKGEVIIEPMTFNVNRFFDLKKICLDNNEQMKFVNIKSIRIHNKNVALSFDDHESQEDIIQYVGSYVKIHRSESPSLPQGTYYYYQLENLDVYNEEGLYLGKIFHIMKAGGADVYTIRDEDGRELLIPAIKDSILDIDLVRKKMIVRVLKMY